MIRGLSTSRIDLRARRRRDPAHERGPRALLRSVLLVLLASLAVLPACRKEAPRFEDVKPADELYQEGIDRLKGRKILGLFRYVDYDAAIETFQSIIDNYPFSEFEEKAQLKIADAYFEDERYEEALAYYQEFADQHSTDPRAPGALLRVAQCHYEQVQSIDRDQAAARKASTALEALIQQHPYAEETRQGEEMLVELRTRLARNMLHIADFYLERDHWQSAAARYRRVLDEFPGLGLDARALYRLGLCLENMKRDDEALRLYHVVVENYADSPSARSARARIARAE